jgi:hypothetical protein
LHPREKKKIYFAKIKRKKLQGEKQNTPTLYGRA